MGHPQNRRIARNQADLPVSGLVVITPVPADHDPTCAKRLPKS